MTNNSNETDSKLGLKHLLWTAGAIAVVWVASGFLIYHFAPSGNYGTFGDMFGAVNSLFSGLAFACLIFATFMQRQELALQRKELELARKEAAATRAEIKGQKEQAIAQNATLARQQFESIFFESLRLLRSAVDSFASSREDRPPGTVSIEVAVRNVCQFVNHSGDFNLASIEKQYSERRVTTEKNASRMIRNLAGVLNLILNSELNEKQVYADILASVLSNGELILIMLFVSYKADEIELRIQLRAACKTFSLFSTVELPEELRALAEFK